MSGLTRPFGEICFEAEKRKFRENWEEYFFEHTSFVQKSLDPATYLIVGRRGSGKSSLTEHFQYQAKYPDPVFINFVKAENYTPELFDIAKKMEYSTELAIQKLVEVWDYLIWQLIFKKCSHMHPAIKKAVVFADEEHSSSAVIKLLLKGIGEKMGIAETGKEIIDYVAKYNRNKNSTEAKEQILKMAEKKAFFIVIDSREQCSVKNIYEMWITAALVQFASEFNTELAYNNIHIKVCIADEIFPYLKEEYITNTLKYVRDVLYMQWRPKDLIRLICWRFFKYLKINKLIEHNEEDIEWNSYDDINKKIWLPYFGEFIINRRGVKEKTFPYLLRHTHLRPRQLILVCNKMAAIAADQDSFPYFSEEIIKQAIIESEIDLADELINSYANIYPNAGDIISALEGMPIEFNGNELHKVGQRTASQWTEKFSKMEFSKLVIEMGIVGRKRGVTDPATSIIRADFEYTIIDRLFVNEKDTCVIHPLFYSKLNINKGNAAKNTCVYPFPDQYIASMGL